MAPTCDQVQSGASLQISSTVVSPAPSPPAAASPQDLRTTEDSSGRAATPADDASTNHAFAPSPAVDRPTSRRCTTFLYTPRLETFIIAIGTCIALAALVMQARSNALTREGNALAEKAYRLQMWQDCHGRNDTIKIPECQNVNPPDMWHASLKSHILPRNHERRHGEMFEMQRHYFRALSEDSRRLVEKHSGPLRGIKTWLPIVVFGLISCHVCFLSLEHLTTVQAKRIKIRLQNSRYHDRIANGKSEAPTDKKQALACVFPLWFWYISVPQVLLAALGGWNAGLSACSVVLLVFLVVHFLNEGRQRRLNVVLTARKDEEASEPELPHVELQTFSEFGRDVSLGYAMNLKQRFGRRHRGAGKL